MDDRHDVPSIVHTSFPSKNVPQIRVALLRVSMHLFHPIWTHRPNPSFVHWANVQQSVNDRLDAWALWTLYVVVKKQRHKYVAICVNWNRTSRYVTHGNLYDSSSLYIQRCPHLVSFSLSISLLSKKTKNPQEKYSWISSKNMNNSFPSTYSASLFIYTRYGWQ